MNHWIIAPVLIPALAGMLLLLEVRERHRLRLCWQRRRLLRPDLSLCSRFQRRQRHGRHLCGRS